MSLEDLIITIYCSIEERYDEVTKGIKLRLRSSASSLSDKQVLTMRVLGESIVG